MKSLKLTLAALIFAASATAFAGDSAGEDARDYWDNATVYSYEEVAAAIKGALEAIDAGAKVVVTEAGEVMVGFYSLPFKGLEAFWAAVDADCNCVDFEYGPQPGDAIQN